MRITALAGGVGGARFLQGLLRWADGAHQVTAIGNTGDDLWIHGLRVCPDLDTVMYTLGGGISTERGWGREDETFTVRDELAAYQAPGTWFGLGDRDIATHLIRTRLLREGWSLSAVTEHLCRRWQPGLALLPMTDAEAETHVLLADGTALHFQEWWVRHRAALPAVGFELRGAAQAPPAPGVLEAIADADVVVLPPSNPIVSIGTILQVPGVREALRATNAPVVGLSPIVGGAPVRGMADACLSALGIDTTALAVAAHYGARQDGGILDAWLVDTVDADVVAPVESLGIACRSVPLMMTDVDATARMAAEALALAGRP